MYVATKPKLADISPVPETARRNDHARLLAAFYEVAPEHNWRDRIETVVKIASKDDERLIVEAVMYFTGSVAYLSQRPGGLTRVMAKGFYATQGA
jgi:hypothetical protein